MVRITLDKIRHAYGPAPSRVSDYALQEISQVFEDGGAYALLGPSGCGKTTLLNIISGLLAPSEGRLLFGERDVTLLDPRARNIAQVFQFPVIYDTMTVYDNLAFPLRNRKMPQAQVRAKVHEVLAMLGLEDQARRKAQGLNADEKQKISLGRGLVRDDVGAILFDEPLTVIDPHMKWRLRTQLKALHQRVGHTMIYVTHDQTEALTFADQVVVMYEGQVVQTGTPAQLFETPAHTFVGYFIGSPGMNILPAEISGTNAKIGDTVVSLSAGLKSPPSGKVEIGVRPEHLTLGETGAPVSITSVQDVGARRIVRAVMGGQELVIMADENAVIPARPKVAFDAARTGVFVDGWRVETGA